LESNFMEILFSIPFTISERWGAEKNLY